MRVLYTGASVPFANSNHSASRIDSELTRGRLFGNGAGDLYRFPLRAKELAGSPASALDCPSVVGMIDVHCFGHEILASL